jgi:hypothetical protein
MKCSHTYHMGGNVQGCYLPLSRETAVYPEIKIMEAKLGRRVTEDDLNKFAYCAFHGGGSSREAALLYFHTAYQGKPLLPPSRTQKAVSAPTPAKQSREVLEARALATRFRFGLSPEAALEAAKRSRIKGTTIETQLIIQRMIEGRRRKLAAARNAVAAAAA